MKPEIAVRITDDEEFEGYTAYILNTETDTNGESIPDGWVEVVFDPMDANGYVTELFREDDLQLVC